MNTVNKTTIAPSTRDSLAADLGSSAGDTVRLSADYENNAETWWDAARTALHAGNTGMSSAAQKVAVAFLNAKTVRDVEATRLDAAEFRAWAEEIDGYADGPTHAPHPFNVTD